MTFSQLTPDLVNGTLFITYTSYSPGTFYLYIAYRDMFADVFQTVDDWWIEIQDYCIVEVNIDSYRAELDNNFNLECASGKYCIYTSSVWSEAALICSVLMTGTTVQALAQETIH